MKRQFHLMYVAALMEHARRKTIGATAPVVVNAYRFFDEACYRADIAHTYSSIDTKRILDRFDDPLRHACHTDEEGFPISVLKMPRLVIATAGHGRQAVIDEDRTPERYRQAATINGSNPYDGWALFGPDVPKDHPIVGASLVVEQRIIESRRDNFNSKVARIAPMLSIGESNHRLVANLPAE
jgi:hypothetical protein